MEAHLAVRGVREYGERTYTLTRKNPRILVHPYTRIPHRPTYRRMFLSILPVTSVSSGSTNASPVILS